jgi:hypothetical protein
MARRLHGWHLFICADCGARCWVHTKNRRYGRQECRVCKSPNQINHGTNDPAERAYQWPRKAGGS